MCPLKANRSYKKFALKFLAFIVALLCGTAAYLYYVRETSVLYSHTLVGDMLHEPTFAIFNPFRDRSPEKVAEGFLRSLREKRCEETMIRLNLGVEFCERETRHPLIDWQLKNRADTRQKTQLYYRVKREGYSGYDGPVWLTLEMQGEQWIVVDYECFY